MSNSGGGCIVTALWLFAIDVKICSNLKAFSTQCRPGAVAVGVARTRRCLSLRSSSSRIVRITIDFNLNFNGRLVFGG